MEGGIGMSEVLLQPNAAIATPVDAPLSRSAAHKP